MVAIFTLYFFYYSKEVNGPPNNGQDVHMNGIMSDTEMEVDSETAEKENEESLSKLELTEGQTATESGVTKKKRKRKKKDSELEADNVLEEITVSAGICGGERSRKKSKKLKCCSFIVITLLILMFSFASYKIRSNRFRFSSIR